MSAQGQGGKAAIAAVDDEPFILEAWTEMLGERYDVQLFSDPFAAKDHFACTKVDLALLDLRMPGMDGLALLGALKLSQPDAEAIMVTAHGTIQTAVLALQAGAYDFLCKPIDDLNAAMHRIESALERKRLREVNATLASRLAAFSPDTRLIGDSLALQKVRDLIDRVACSPAAVLICGESGTGKELAARSVHSRSDRSDKPFVAVNCGALADSLIDSELFGHERGAFTGATQGRRGLFEAADGGVLFLDEIGDVPLQTQVRLLRVLQEGEVKPVGSTRSRRVDVRVVAATNRNLQRAMRTGEFREDLYYRISTFCIELPPLRDRPNDIPTIATHLLERFTHRANRASMSFSEDALGLLLGYAWPGNVRELNNVIEHAATLCTTAMLTPDDFPRHVVAQGRRKSSAATTPTEYGSISTLPFSGARKRVLEEFEERYLHDLLSAAGGNLSEAARRSGIDRTNLRRMVKRYGIEPTTFQLPVTP